MRNIVFNDGMFCGVVRKHNSDSSPKSPAQKTEAELIAEAMADGELSVLTLGNSFSVDAMQYSYEIATDLGVEKVRLGNLYEPGCSILEHYNYANGNLSAFKQYNSDQMEMYNQIIAATKEKIKAFP